MAYFSGAAEPQTIASVYPPKKDPFYAEEHFSGVVPCFLFRPKKKKTEESIAQKFVGKISKK
jgi:hypothetical protein